MDEEQIENLKKTMELLRMNLTAPSGPAKSMAQVRRLATPTTSVINAMDSCRTPLYGPFCFFTAWSLVDGHDGPDHLLI